MEMPLPPNPTIKRAKLQRRCAPGKADYMQNSELYEA